MQPYNEPPIDPLDDTSPSLAMRPVDGNLVQPNPERTPGWHRIVGGVSLLLALILTGGAIVLLLMPAPEPDPIPEVVQADVTQMTEISPVQTDIPQTDVPDTDPTVETPPTESGPVIQPTADSARLVSLLQTPVGSEPVRYTGLTDYNPFTIIDGDRPRSEFLEYTAVRGDTISEIALRYGLQQESIAWCNDRRIIFVLRPGDVLRIPPVDGACYRILGTRNETIAEIAEDFNVEPMTIINSPYDNLYDLTPDDTLPGGKFLFIPGGEGEIITWNPGSDVETDASGNVVSVSFAPGQAGSCGAVSPGGGAAWGNPLPSGRWVRGFYPGHSGIDLSASVGTQIYAANTGPVLFSGFSQWGYGEAVVLAHGTYSTLYGHMSQRMVSCGQSVVVGQVVGLVGSTGNSSGPHLHFEIRVNDQPVNPSGWPGIGW